MNWRNWDFSIAFLAHEVLFEVVQQINRGMNCWRNISVVFCGHSSTSRTMFDCGDVIYLYSFSISFHLLQSSALFLIIRVMWCIRSQTSWMVPNWFCTFDLASVAFVATDWALTISYFCKDVVKLAIYRDSSFVIGLLALLLSTWKACWVHGLSA
jgi:hypothetical protein